MRKVVHVGKHTYTTFPNHSPADVQEPHKYYTMCGFVLHAADF